MFSSRIAVALSSVLMNAMVEGGEGAAGTEPTPQKLTAVEKLQAKLDGLRTLVESKTVEYHEVAGQLQALLLVANVGQGDTVTGTTGIGAKKVTHTGVVLGVTEDEVKGKLVKIQSGTGFDTMTHVIKAVDIVSVTPQASPIAVAMGTAAAGVSEAPVDADQAEVDAYLNTPQVAIAE